MPQPSASLDAYRDRDNAILRFVGTYSVALIQVINHVIGEGKQLGHVVRRLSDEGYLQLQARALEGAVSYCRLTTIGAERIQLPKDRATKSIGVQALDKYLAVLTWCCLSPDRRYRIERRELEELIPGIAVPTNQVHCVAAGPHGPTIYRVQLVQGHFDTALKTLRHDIEHARAGLQAAISAGVYRYALLVDSQAKVTSLRSSVQRSGLSKLAAIDVDQGATAATVAAYLRGFRKRSLAE